MEILINERAEKTCQEILDDGTDDNYEWSPPYCKGLFRQGARWVAFDNTIKNCWMEDFDTAEAALNWLAGKEIESDLKPLTQYLTEYLSHVMIQSVSSNFCWTEKNLEENLKIWLEQALDAYESTENVVIQTIKKKDK